MRFISVEMVVGFETDDELSYKAMFDEIEAALKDADILIVNGWVTSSLKLVPEEER
jgi:hypothetical protein